jgi:hypothetical protein
VGASGIGSRRCQGRVVAALSPVSSARERFSHAITAAFSVSQITSLLASSRLGTRHPVRVRESNFEVEAVGELSISPTQKSAAAVFSCPHWRDCASLRLTNCSRLAGLGNMSPEPQVPSTWL